MDAIIILVADLIFKYVEPKYVAVIALVTGSLYAVSEYLGGTERFKANNTIQAISNILKKLKASLSRTAVVMIFSIMGILLLSAVPSPAETALYEGIYTDGYLALGRQFDVNTTGEEIRLTSQKNEIRLDGEIGVRWKAFRPFVSYNALTENYIMKSAGVDWSILSKDKLGALGLRTSWNQHRAYGVIQRYVYTGIFMKW